MGFGEFLFFLIGLAALVAGAELLVRGASGLAFSLGIRPLVVGLTIVAFGTSAPEMAVSVGAALDGQADLALGNVVGSNIFNILFILGLSALIVPLKVDQQLIRTEVPLLIGVSLVLLVVGWNGAIGRGEGVAFCAGIVAYTGYLLARAKGLPEETGLPEDRPVQSSLFSRAVQVAFIGLGLVLLVRGADILLDSSIAIARQLGVSELVIGLTLVAAGTSLPEVATSAVAALRGERDIAVGNVIGSNLFNILAVLGLSAAVSPSGVVVSGAAIWFDIPVMVAATLACLPVFFTGAGISRQEGIGFLLFYLLYLGVLYFRSVGV